MHMVESETATNVRQACCP